MKSAIRWLDSFRPAIIFMAAAGAVCFQPLRADAATNGPSFREYMWSEIGVAVIPEFNGTVSSLSSAGMTTEEVTLKMTPGFAVQGGFGERFLPWLSGELEGGFYYNDVDQLTSSLGTRSFNASLLQVPIYLNVVFHVPDNHRLAPFAGAGAGARVTWFDIEDNVSLGSAGVVALDGSSTEVSFGYQAFAGLRLNVRRDTAFSVAYRFNGGVSPTYSLYEAATGAAAADLKGRDIAVHTLSLGFYVRF